MGDAPFVAGTEAPTLADCFAAPMMNCLMAVPQGAKVVAPGSPLAAWWRRIAERAAVAPYLD